MKAQAAVEDDIGAALLAWAMLRFAQSHLRPAVKNMPEYGGILGEVAVKFFPSGLTVPISDAALALLEMRKPVAISSLSARGLFGVWFPEDLPEAERQVFWDASERGTREVTAFSERFALTPDSRILLKANGEQSIFPMRILLRCLRDYHIFTGWGIGVLRDDSRAEASLKLVRADGTLPGEKALPPPDYLGLTKNNESAFTD